MASIKKKKWLKIIVITMVGAVVLYNFLFSSWFACRLIFPIFSRYSEVNIQADSWKISLLGGKLDVENLQLGDDSGIVRLKVKNYHGELAVWKFLCGDLKIQNVKVAHPELVVDLMEKSWDFSGDSNANQVKNIEKQLDAAQKRRFLFALNNLKIENFNLTLKTGSVEKPGIFYVENLNFIVPEFRNNSESKIELDCHAAVKESFAAFVENGSLKLSCSLKVNDYLEVETADLNLMINMDKTGRIFKSDLQLQSENGEFFIRKFEFRGYDKERLENYLELSGVYRDLKNYSVNIKKLFLGEHWSELLAGSLGFFEDTGKINLTVYRGIVRANDKIIEFELDGILKRGADKKLPSFGIKMVTNGYFERKNLLLRVNQIYLELIQSQKVVITGKLNSPIEADFMDFKKLSNVVPVLHFEINDFDAGIFDYLALPQSYFRFDSGFFGGKIVVGVEPFKKRIVFSGNLTGRELSSRIEEVKLFTADVNGFARGDYDFANNILNLTEVRLTPGKKNPGNWLLLAKMDFDFEKWFFKIDVSGNRLDRNFAKLFPESQSVVDFLDLPENSYVNAKTILDISDYDILFTGNKLDLFSGDKLHLAIGIGNFLSDYEDFTPIKPVNCNVVIQDDGGFLLKKYAGIDEAVKLNGVLNFKTDAKFKKLYLEKSLLKITHPDFGSIPGDFRLNAVFVPGVDWSNWKFRSNIDFANLNVADGIEPLNGKFQAALDKTGDLYHNVSSTLKVNSGKAIFADMKLREIFSKNHRYSYELTSDASDLSSFLALFGISFDKKDGEADEFSQTIREREKELENLEKYQPLIDFGENEINLKCNFRKIKLEDNLLNFSCDIFGKKRSISSNNLLININRDNFSGQLSLTDTNNYLYSRLILENRTEVNLPLLYFAEYGDLNDIKGRLDSLKLDVSAKFNGDSNFFYDSLNGSFKGKVLSVAIPNQFSRSTVGSLLILPFEIVASVYDVLPMLAKQEYGSFFEVMKKFNSNHFAVLDFSGGDFNIEAVNGTIKVNRFHLIGRNIKSFDFNGKMRLGSDPGLNLHSNIDVNNIQMPIDIYGTIDNPQFDIKNTVLKFFGENAGNFVDFLNKFIKN